MCAVRLISRKRFVHVTMQIIVVHPRPLSQLERKAREDMILAQEQAFEESLQADREKVG